MKRKNEQMIYFLINDTNNVIEKIYKQRKRVEDNLKENYSYRGLNIDIYPAAAKLKVGANMKRFFIEELNQFYY